MKDKNVAGILALFFGWLGIHRFYLGQIGLGILYMFFFWISWIIALIDAIAFFAMDKVEFDEKYNREMFHQRQTRYDRRTQDRRERWEQRQRKEAPRARPQAPQRTPKQRPRATSAPQRQRRHNPFKSSGLEKYREYDYEGAIEDFEKALEISPKDIAVHFNLACSYSLMEKADNAFYHLDKAVTFGFNDFQKIKEHDALAFLRIQDEFDNFEENSFRLTPKLEAPKVNLLDEIPQNTSNDLLEQLQRLGELKEKGLLTEEEFVVQKKKLLG